MAALDRLCPEPDSFTGAATAGATLPFLPTLVVAALLGVGALCWDSADPTPQPSGPAIVATESSKPLPQMARMSIDPSRPAADAAPRPIAAFAFAAIAPVTLEAPAVVAARAEPRPSLRIVRIAPPPSGCPGPRCKDDPLQTASMPLRRAHVATGTTPVPALARPFASTGSEVAAEEAAFPGQTSSDEMSLDRALPFAPILVPPIRALQRTVGLTVGYVGSQAAAIGTEAAEIGTKAVTGLVGGLR